MLKQPGKNIRRMSINTALSSYCDDKKVLNFLRTLFVCRGVKGRCNRVAAHRSIGSGNTIRLRISDHYHSSWL